VRKVRGPRGLLFSRVDCGAIVTGALALTAVTALPAASPEAVGANAVAAHAEGPPAGHTGGFGEPTCQACHMEYDLNLPGGDLGLEGWPEAYRPGEVYTVTVVLRVDGMSLAGFQLAVRHESGRQAGGFVALDGRVAVRDSAGVEYAQHTRAGTDVADGRVASWNLQWVAPAEGGAVHAHLSANSSNGDDSPFGDLVYVGNWPARELGGIERARHTVLEPPR
jgi:hypothetical protein